MPKLTAKVMNKPEYKPMPNYAITIAKLDATGKVIFQASAGASDLDKFTETDLLKFIDHFKQQLETIKGGTDDKVRPGSRN